MNRCPLSNQECADAKYSLVGLRKLSISLADLEDLPFTAQELRLEAARLASRMSIQGVQPKLSAILRPTLGRFEIVANKGTFILKPQTLDYPELPENEDLTMDLAEDAGIEVPLHGLVYSKDKSLTYFIRRFDRVGHNKKLAVEDFAQLLSESRATKYNSSMEATVKAIDTFATFPLVEHVELFRRVIFCFLVGNEDMHLKNFSMITTSDNIVKLSPAYDLLNYSIVLPTVKEELALSLAGKKRNLTKRDFIKYFAMERLRLEPKVITKVMNTFGNSVEKWKDRITHSFLSEKMKERYLALLEERLRRLDIHHG